MFEAFLEAREELTSSTQAAEEQGSDEGKKQTAKENGVLSLPVLLGLHADDCHGGQHLLTTIHTTTKYYLSSYMIYCGFIGNCGWYGYWCYGLVLVGRD